MFTCLDMSHFRTGNLTVSPIKLMEIEATKYSNVVSLAQGIPSFDTPECIKQAAIDAIKNGLSAKYSLTPGIPELREVVSEKLREEGMHYRYDTEIIVTCGAAEAITASLLSILNPGDEVIIPSPVYASYSEYIKTAHGVPVFVPLNEDDGWSVDIESFEKHITPKTKVIFFCNPSNPTGTIFSEKDLRKLGEISEKHDLFLLSDEVYKDFVYNEEEIFSLATIPKLKHRIIRVFSFSKTYAMTGWRVAFVHSHQDNIKEILKCHDSMVTCAPVVSQYAAIAAFTKAEASVEEFKKQYLRRLKMTVHFLNQFPDIFQTVEPNSSYFVFPKIFPKENKTIDSVAFCMKMLEKIQVALVPGIAFGPSGEGHLRLSFGRSEEDLQESFIRMEKFFKNSKNELKIFKTK